MQMHFIPTFDDSKHALDYLYLKRMFPCCCAQYCTAQRVFLLFIAIVCFWILVDVVSLDNKLCTESRNKQRRRAPYAIATFLSFEGFEGCYIASQYIKSIAKLGVSLKQYSRKEPEFEMILLVTGWSSCVWLHATDLKRLGAIGWQLISVDPIFYQPKQDEAEFSVISGNRYEHTCQFTKLHLWNQTRYKRILYLDADMLVVDFLPLDFIFLDTETNKASPKSLGMEACIPETSKACGAGAMLIVPDAHEYKRLLMFRQALSFDRFYQEQSYLLSYFSENNGKRFAFPLENLVVPVHYLGNLSSKVVHYISNFKPWNQEFCTANALMCNVWRSACDNIGCLSSSSASLLC